MASSAPRKFGFDTVFDDAGRVIASAPRPKRMFTADEVEAAKAAAFAEGQRSVVAVAESEAAAALAQIAQHARAALSALAKVAHDHRVSSADLARAVARKVADSALERFPEAPIAAAMTELAREIEAAPKLMVRVAPDLLEKVQAELERTAQAIGFSGAIVAHAEASLPPAAFQLDWGEGRAAFDPEAAAARIAAALEEALAAEGLHAEPLIPASEADHG
ncbi:MAG TPA: flagellar assembly protein FliH [Brevundimonas sp.]|nr:flagellar assembly protein FliH [Brevundimonas sp.]